jgi:hypothetical protein
VEGDWGRGVRVGLGNGVVFLSLSRAHFNRYGNHKDSNSNSTLAFSLGFDKP